MFAVLKDSIVISVLDMTDDEIIEKQSNGFQVVDVSSMPATPEEGWLLSGNTLVPPVVVQTGEQSDAFQQKQQRLFGEKLANKATDWFGARNLKLARDGAPVDVAALSSALLNTKLLLQGGALKTARTVCGLVKGNFPNHTDIFDLIIAEITNFLTANGWN